LDVNNGNLKNHLEPDWNDIPIEKITIDAINEWAWKKKEQVNKRGKQLSWVTIKNILRTMQVVLSAHSKDKQPPFSQKGLDIPQRDKDAMAKHRRNMPSYSWDVALKVAAEIRNSTSLGPIRKEQYATAVLLNSASGVRISELFALKGNDIDFKASTIRIDEASGQRQKGLVGDLKNVAADRHVPLKDGPGLIAMSELKKLIGEAPDPDTLIYRSERGNPLRATTFLNQGVYPALEALGLRQKGGLRMRSGVAATVDGNSLV